MRSRRRSDSFSPFRFSHLSMISITFWSLLSILSWTLVDASIQIYRYEQVIFLSNTDFYESLYRQRNFDDDGGLFSVTGKFSVAEFFSDSDLKVNNGTLNNSTGKSSNSYVDFEDSDCLIKPFPEETAVLFVPFEIAWDSQCKSYSDIIKRNNWTTDDTFLFDGDEIYEDETNSSKSDQNVTAVKFKKRSQKRELQADNNNLEYSTINNIPRVIVFTSINYGDPGVREPFMGEKAILKKSVPYLSLIKHSDMSALRRIGVENKNSMNISLSFTSDVGPYRKFLRKPLWIAWSIIFGMIYGLLALTSGYFMLRFFCIGKGTFEISLGNPNTFILPAIAYCSIMSLIILELDPYSIREEKLSVFGYSVIINLNFLILCLCYIILLVSWIKVSKDKVGFGTNFSVWFHHILPIAHKLLYITTLLTVATFVIDIIYDPYLVSGFDSMIIIPSLIWQVFVIVIVNLGYLLFAGFMILSLLDQRQRQETAQDFLTILSTFALLFALQNPILTSHFPTTTPRGMPLPNITDEPTPEQIAEDERRNSAAYTIRTPVVQPPSPAFIPKVVVKQPQLINSFEEEHHFDVGDANKLEEANEEKGLLVVAGESHCGKGKQMEVSCVDGVSGGGSSGFNDISLE
ncbi:3740_t:CDS:2 [Ambispora gerdemannii]|uniref:3740_t:CDS:1 n=1 Tax=Ambispora gerdemannii TaxID=144530 RepID=A0A9N9FPQ9_9GLOM|nr:3740_t:CDS:2 [Ambispora gerdemannii]